MDAVDTNVLVRLVVRDDDAQFRLAQEFVARGVWVSHLVLAETTWVLRDSYGMSHDEIADVLERFLEQEQFTIQDREVVIDALKLYRLDPSLKFSDYLSREIARRAGHRPI